jgi:hypothetical protein
LMELICERCSGIYTYLDLNASQHLSALLKLSRLVGS